MAAKVIPPWQRNDPAAYRPQPARTGPDFWPTIDRHLVMALVHEVLPVLPPAPIWEPAAGEGHLVDPIRNVGREVFASDLYPGRGDIMRHDFLRGPPPTITAGAILATNGPHSRLTQFMVRGLALIDAGHLSGMVLLSRLGADTTDSRADAFDRAAFEWKCCWRPWWKPRQPGDKQGRFTFQWTAWLHGSSGAPVTRHLRKATLEAPQFWP